VRKANKAIITCAVTGSIHTPTMSPHLPITPERIAAASVARAMLQTKGRGDIAF
jgi:uncharacterized protein (DUF849 family)